MYIAVYCIIVVGTLRYSIVHWGILGYITVYYMMLLRLWARAALNPSDDEVRLRFPEQDTVDHYVLRMTRQLCLSL